MCYSEFIRTEPSQALTEYVAAKELFLFSQQR